MSVAGSSLSWRGRAHGTQRFDAPVAAATAVPAYGGGGRGVVAGAGRARPAAPGVEYLACTSSIRRGRSRALRAARCAIWWSRRTGWARSGFRRRRCICGRARRGWDGSPMSNAKPISPPGAVPEPVPDPPRRAMPQPGQPGAGPVCWRVCQRISRPRYRYRPWLVARPSSAPRMTAPASRRPTSCGSGTTAGRGLSGPRPRAELVRSSRYICMQSGAALAAAVGGGAGRPRLPALAPADRSRQRRLDGERVWRGAVGRSAVVGASGHTSEVGPAGVVARRGGHRQRVPRPRRR